MVKKFMKRKNFIKILIGGAIIPLIPKIPPQERRRDTRKIKERLNVEMLNNLYKANIIGKQQYINIMRKANLLIKIKL